MTFFHAILLGIIEGLTEFLPISSTGHLVLASNLLHIPQTDFAKTFEIAIQSGAILAVVALYIRSFFDWELLKRLFVAFLPTAFLGLVFYRIIRDVFLISTATILSSLFFGGVAIILFEYWHKENSMTDRPARTMSYLNAVIIGVFQSIALIPGISRAAATILGGLALGFSRKTIVEFSFLLAVPTMLAATALDLLHSGHHFSAHDVSLLAVGFVVSFLVAIAAIRVFLRFIKTRTFVPFGVYRIAVSVILAIWFFVR